MGSQSPSLRSLPNLVWSNITAYLSTRDLLNLSATCSEIRAVLNSDYIWNRFADVGQALGKIQSLVQPEITAPLDNTSLEPLCRNRKNISRQNQLCNNYRRGKCVQHSYTHNGRILELNNDFNKQRLQRTFNDVYFFMVERTEDNDVIHVLNIESTPYIVTSFTMPGQVESTNDEVIIHVFKDKLITVRCHQTDVFRINLPDVDFPHVLSIEKSYSTYLYNVFAFVEPLYCSSIDIWDLDKGMKLRSIPSTFDGTHWTRGNILTGLTDSKHVLLYLELNHSKYVVGYDLIAMEFSSFKIIPSLNSDTVVANSEYVVLFSSHFIDAELYTSMTNIYVYDYNNSTLLAETFECCYELDTALPQYSEIVNNNLMVPWFYGSIQVKILSLNTLETLQVIHESDCTYAEYLYSMYYLSFKCVSDFILISKNGGEVGIVDVQRNKTVFDWDGGYFSECYSNKSCSKIILEKNNPDYPGFSLVVLSFW